MKPKVKLDWDTVELVASSEADSVASVSVSERMVSYSDTPFVDWRGRSAVKKILSGAAMKARAEGVPHTHVQLRQLLSTGLSTFVYGWDLVVAAVDSDNGIAHGIASAVIALRKASNRLSRNQ